LPAVRAETGGLRPSSVADLLTALQNQSGQQLRDVCQIVGDGIDRQLERNAQTIEKLQTALRNEQVAHARTDERLTNALVKSGTSASLNALGGALLGYGLGSFEHTTGKIFSAVGILLVGVGCWPLWPSWKK